MTSGKRNQIYWLSQATGWGLFVLGNILSASIQGSSHEGIYIISLFILIVGILTTHVFRMLIHKWGWTRLNIPALIPRVFAATIAMSLIFVLLNTIFTNIISGVPNVLADVFTIPFLLNTLNFSTLFLLWSIIYFAVHVFENWKREEIANLELKASQTEIELNSFKAQMNPHFMFNSMNSIRALIDEDPLKAKEAITSLSGILRNNLTLGRSQTIPLSEEMDLVEKYLSLEKIRFESRLDIQLDISPESLSCHIPPFMLQTIVENGIKHGISKRIEGGRLLLQTCLENELLKIVTINSGEYAPSNSGQEGIGVVNTRKRLQLIYKGKASLHITPLKDEVKVELIIPDIKPISHESTDN